MRLTLEHLNVISKITFAGVLHLRTADEKRGYKGPLFYAYPGDLVISKIRVAQGSLCVVPNELDHLAVSSEYPVYAVDQDRISADWSGKPRPSKTLRGMPSRLRSA